MPKILSIKIVAHDFISAFPNKKKTKDKKDEKLPDYKADGVAVWVYDYIEKAKEEQV